MSNCPFAVSDAEAALIAKMREAGFQDQALRAVASNPPLIRRFFVRTMANVEPDLAVEAQIDPVESGCPMFKAPLAPLRLSAGEWMEYLEDRNAAAAVRPCTVVHGPQFWNHAVFKQTLNPATSGLLLVETSNGMRPRASIESAANQVVPGCVDSTAPVMVFEILRVLWTRFSELNAAYVMVMGPTAPSPILFSPPSGPLRIGFVNDIPKNYGYTGYVAYATNHPPNPA